MIFEFSEANIPNRRIDTYDDLKSALQWLGFAARRETYGGYVNDDGTTASLPSGWTSAKTGTGAYTVTHSLGSTDYIVLAMTAGGVVGVCSLDAINANDFDITIVSMAASAQDTDFTFIVLPTS